MALILQVALDTPLRRVFDYRAPDATGEAAATGECGSPPEPGVRVRVPFGRRTLVGILIATTSATSVPPGKLRTASGILDREPLFDPVTFGLLRWAADYYHHPIGEVFAAALPASLRKGKPLKPLEAGITVPNGPNVPGAWQPRPSPHALTAAQAAVLEPLTGSLGRFAAHLLYGVTGSGKTEVYLRAIEVAAADGGQVLVLVPEIALTPQLVERFVTRFGGGVAVLHSALTGTARRDAWRAAHAGRARIVIGTRSAVFTPMPRLALIVVDEEHDPSYKQQEGFRYSARDLAVVRAQRAAVPIILGSATPSLESLDNAAQGRYSKLVLPQRAGSAQAPRIGLVDLRRHACDQGLSQPAMQAIGRHLTAGGQVIVYLNRRGYAPTLFCNACGWVAPCARCDARMTVHRAAGQLRCHHCGAQEPVPALCPACSRPLNPVGQGTERVEETLLRLFPDAPLARLDRDTAGARDRMETVLARVHSGEARVLVGTQMLTKGHHFPDVSLVVVLNADQGLFASDYRATERLAQTIVQVAGRAGREARTGEVLIQTEFPEHPLLHRLIHEGYDGFALSALAERLEAHWPPYSRLALLRAEDRDRDRLDAFLCAAAERARAIAGCVEVRGPAAALIARRADHFRAHLLVEAGRRADLQRFLGPWLAAVEALKTPAGLRWSIDVDPLEVD